MSESKYHETVRHAENEYGFSALNPTCLVNVQGFLLDPEYKTIIFVLPTIDVAQLRGSTTLRTVAEQLASVKLPLHYHGFNTAFVSLWEYENVEF